ncbi:nucleoside-diphosphate-sugar epimerase [Motilibacter peucedani]|uniref:Nucleoside-diphosphate-sugar epimerase n=1 Tax=Motilibacter peucedani TaxID=598650 RepID=A0A420XRM9_9ACTN|nr:NAD-dependent epimerase/dehydratase family protein [Motilibacter peucedani]RKS77457.1 nucleoside-diphosphate-sugar epimerase [Motilibacter peucedani]
MKVLLTGGTGLVGRGVLKALVAHGHEVTALVRSDASAATVAQAGATPLLGDITDVAWLTGQLRQVDGAVHAATTGEGDAVAFDRGVASAAAEAFAGTGKPYVHTGGAWVWGQGADVREDQPFDAPQITAWRADVEKVALTIDGARGTVVAPGIVYGYGTGIPQVLVQGPVVDGALTLVGDGSQHWTTVHSDDLGELYVRVLEDGAAGDYYIGASGQNPTVRELGEAAARGRGLSGAVVAEPVEASRERLGAAFADALLLDQQTSAAKSKALGWTPAGPSLVDELASGSYAS